MTQFITYEADLVWMKYIGTMEAEMMESIKNDINSFHPTLQFVN